MPTRIVKLIQSPRNNSRIINLDADEQGILTGLMGGCCSVVLLWGNFVQGVGYDNMRGHHASGGPGNLDWDALTLNVPNLANTKLVMACAPADFSAPGYGYLAAVMAAVQERQLIYRGGGAHAFSNALINRLGSARPFDVALEERNYTIRNANAVPIM